jgi:hypothetical protein
MQCMNVIVCIYVYNVHGRRYRRTLATPNLFCCNQITANKICLNQSESYRITIFSMLGQRNTCFVYKTLSSYVQHLRNTWKKTLTKQ